MPATFNTSPTLSSARRLARTALASGESNAVGEHAIGDGEVVVVRSPSRKLKENDAEVFSAKGEPSVMAMLPDERRSTAGAMPLYRLPIREFLIECDLEQKYILKFKR